MASNTEDKDEADRHLVKGFFAGLIGGVVAAIAMNQFQKALSVELTGEKRSHGAQSLQKGAPHHGAGRMLEERGLESEDDDSAERLAQTVSVGLFEHALTESEKDKAGTAFHYGYSVFMAAIYGTAAEIWPTVTVGRGMPYGALIWVGADEIVVPALGLSKSAGKYSPAILTAALLSHLVYGLTAEVVRSKVRRVL